MNLDTNKLSSAVRMALTLGAVAAAGVAGTAMAQDTGTTPSTSKNAKELQTIVVTGSRIRRVDIETANPVFAIDRQTITQSGAVTIGDLVQDTPSVSGAATNPRVNNGGGTGAATVSLRGLGSGRTLVLLDGHRIVNGDINAIPVNLIERVEVLNDGGAVTYGSDAIGGVVNFILRKNFQGAEFSTNYGISDYGDGARRGYSALFGQTTDKGSIIAGIDYNKYDAISSNNRSWSNQALYLYSGHVYAFGSSRTPNDRIFLPVGSPLRSQFGCGSLTKLPNAVGTALSDYRCFTSSDYYNYQKVNLILTPQERTNIFALSTYQLTDNIQAYLDVFSNKTSAHYAIAPYPFDASSAGVVISAQSIYNPFGINFGYDPTTNTAYTNFMTRPVNFGQRVGSYSTTTDQAFAGLRGNVGDTSWQWDLNLDYGFLSQGSYATGYINTQELQQAIGPSFYDNGVPTCGTPTAPITGGCVPINIFNINDPAQTALLRKYAVAPFTQLIYVSREVSANANGNVFSLPAGDVSLAVGALYRKEYQNYVVDSLIQTNPASGTCQLGTGCSSPVQGGFNVKEAYAEVLIPILKDAPFAKSLNLDIGSRYSKYSLAGNTTNSKLQVEWHPINDLLLRGTVQQVFRAPSVSALFAGPASSAPTFSDPCIGYVPGVSPANHDAACGTPTGTVASQVPPGGIEYSGNSQTNAIVSGALAAGYNLRPENGKSFDFGLVYDPSWLGGFSTTLDFWRIYLNNTITGINANVVADLCYNNPASPFCAFIHRFPTGQVQFIQTPTVNLGRLDTSGVDFSFRYRLPQFELFGVDPGRFQVNFDSTYISKFNNNPAPGTGTPTYTYAGSYNQSFGNFARWRALASLNWMRGPWDATWRLRYIGNLRVGNPSPIQNQSADLVLPAYVLPIGSVTYSDVSVGYNIAPINTRIQIGVNNVFNKQPPIFYQSSVINANTDVNTYDTIGRYYWGSVTVKF